MTKINQFQWIRLGIDLSDILLHNQIKEKVWERTPGFYIKFKIKSDSSNNLIYF